MQNYTELLKIIKDLIMKIPISRLFLLWLFIASCLLIWKFADIINALAPLLK